MSKIEKDSCDKLHRQEELLQKIFDGKQLYETDTTDDLYFTIKAFRNCIYSGIIPPVTVLCEVAEAFDRYINDNDGMSLQKAFNRGKKSKKA